MTNLNRVVLQGNLTRDPETRNTTTGMVVANFSIAVNSGFGEKEEVSYLDCVVFGKQAEALAKHFAKGKQIIVEGRLRQDRWDDKATGQKRSKVVVILDGFHFAGAKGTDQPQAAVAANASDLTEVSNLPLSDGKLF